MKTTLLLLAAVLAALLLRVVPAYDNVFTPHGVAFQEGDAWFHMRTVQNLVTHFPRRSGFDPYMVYPGGEDVPTAPLFDYLIAGVALMTGSRTLEHVETIGAWTPAVLGALFPLAVFWITRRLFDDMSAVFAAWWMALTPGVLLWMSHLGYTDHHVAESLLALLTLGCLCSALEPNIDTPNVKMTLASGVALGAFLATRPAGIFLIAPIFVLAALIAPEIARVAACTIAIAAAIFVILPATLWSTYIWMALGGAFAALIAVALFHKFGRSRIILIASALAIAAVAMYASPTLRHILIFQAKRAAGWTADPLASTVQEAQPLLHSLRGSPWNVVVQQLGYAWVLAIPALFLAVRMPRRPARTLFLVWTLFLAFATIAQARTAVYFTVCAAMLCGVACAWFVRLFPWRRSAIIALAIVTLAVNIPQSWSMVQIDASPHTPWWEAAAWMRHNTPEPLGGADAWTRYDPALPPGQKFAYPASAYSVAVWWDFGYWVEYLARRIPTSNGTQAGATETAAIFTDPDPASALRGLDRLGSRYMIVDPSLPLFDTHHTGLFPVILKWAGRRADDYYRVYYSDGQPVIFYLPNYYRAMAMRLYMFDARSPAKTETWVVHTIDRTIDWKMKYQTETEADAFMAGKSAAFTLGGFDASIACVSVDDVPGLRLAYSTDARPISFERPVTAVKIFERVSSPSDSSPPGPR